MGSASQKKIMQLCKKIAVPGMKTIVGFGDISNNDKIKGHTKGLLKILERELKQHCTVIPIDEYKTSKKCHDCKDNVENCFVRDMMYSVIVSNHIKFMPSSQSLV